MLPVTKQTVGVEKDQLLQDLVILAKDIQLDTQQSTTPTKPSLLSKDGITSLKGFLQKYCLYAQLID